MKVLEKNLRFFVILLDFATIALFIFAKPIVYAAAAILPKCPFYEMGFLCPACGGTRCFYNFVAGNWWAAFGYNPCIFVTILIALTLMVFLNLAFLFRFSRAKRVVSWLTDYRLIIGWAVVYSLFGLGRNFL